MVLSIVLSGVSNFRLIEALSQMYLSKGKSIVYSPLLLLYFSVIFVVVCYLYFLRAHYDYGIKVIESINNMKGILYFCSGYYR